MASELARISKAFPQLRLDALPAEYNGVIDWPGWVSAIAFKTKYVEPNPDHISQMLAIRAMMAGTAEEVFAEGGILHAQDMVEDKPSAETDPFKMTSLYVAASNFETGNPCYVIMEGTWLTTGENFRCGTGATNIQATLIGLINNGATEFILKFKRGLSKDRGGRYLLFLMPGA